ncbi:MAG: SCO1664 family protein [Anaerolineales bacterium]|nr:MAG: SCO1664 family protein [Anaerolineales bacterium]
MLALQTGELELEGQFTWGSNYTFLVRVGAELEGVYKPVKGEQPLWDFPSETLAGREVAAFLLSEALGWQLVPPTVFRSEGPFGPGSLQLRVPHDPEQHYFTFEDAVCQRLRPAAVFDLLANNADRKGGHILLGDDGHLWLIDHGICFHEEPKLRTVIWDFAGEHIPPELVEDVRSLQAKLRTGGELSEQLAAYLSPPELDALRQRVAALLAQPVFPHPPEDERYMPWPPV